MNSNRIDAQLLYRGTVVELSALSNKVGIVTFDSKDSSVNLLSTTVMDELSAALTILETPGQFSGVVFRSSKEDCFIAGADIKEILKAQSLPKNVAFKGCQDGKTLLKRIKSLGYPSVAAISGRCLGGGAELAMACTYRLAVDKKSTVIGLPEVALGVLPGWGGTVNATLTLGFAAAIPLVINPLKPWSARKAWKSGLVSELVPADSLFKRAVELAATGGKVRSAKPSMISRCVRVVGDSFIGSSIIATAAGAMVKLQTRGKYPAPLAALKVMKTALHHSDVSYAYELESRTFAALCHTKASAECVQKFMEYQAAKKKEKSGTK